MFSFRQFSKVFKKMPPKKAVQEKKVLLGRPGNNLKIGIVGSLSDPSSYLISANSRHRSSECRKVIVLQRPLQYRSAAALVMFQPYL